MLIKIISCKDTSLWYNSHINETFKVHRISSDRIWTREPDSWACLNFVLNEDWISVKYT